MNIDRSFWREWWEEAKQIIPRSAAFFIFGFAMGGSSKVIVVPFLIFVFVLCLAIGVGVHLRRMHDAKQERSRQSGLI